jgi:phosphoribosylaminoimidazole-succinocarboxamide synthase
LLIQNSITRDILVITPTTKAREGHDEDISRDAILDQQLVEEKYYLQLEKYAQDLFAFGTAQAKEQGLILVDTKYEFGLYRNEILLIDEVHTPDSSRYFYADGYTDRQHAGEAQKQLSKEFVREWLMDHGFQGKAGEQIPEMDEYLVKSISERYIELYESVTGAAFKKDPTPDISLRIKKNIENYLN